MGCGDRSIGGLQAGLAALAVLVLLAACSGRGWDEGGVVARVNGYKITMERFQEFYMPPRTPIRSAEEIMQELGERLDQLIGYVLVEDAGREAGLLREELYQRRQELFENDILNRLYQQRVIVEQVEVDDSEVQEILDRSIDERHFQHILVLTPEAAAEVRERLEAGDEWGELAVQYSHDSEAVISRGDLGWLTWGSPPLSIYPELEEIAYRLPEGSWEGPIQQGNEYHFIKVLEERPRVQGTPAEEWAGARAIVFNRKLRDAEQEFSDRVWAEGEFSFNADHFHWLIDQIHEAFTTLPEFNAVPILNRDDQRRIVIASRWQKYTAQDLLDRLEMLNPQERDNAISTAQWRDRFLGWAMTDRVAEMARDLKLHRTREFHTRLRNYIESYLYSIMRNTIRSSVAAPTPEQVEAYYNAHREEFQLPERRRFIEVLVATRAEAEDILRQAQAGAEMRVLAYDHTIREGFRDNFGHFSAIRPGQFGALGEAVFATPLNEIGPIVETPLGFSVFQVTTIHPPQDQSLDEVRDNLARQMHTTAREDVENAFLESAWREARIEKNMDRLREYASQVARATRMADADSTGE